MKIGWTEKRVPEEGELQQGDRTGYAYLEWNFRKTGPGSRSTNQSEMMPPTCTADELTTNSKDSSKLHDSNYYSQA